MPVRVDWPAPVVAGGLALLLLVALFAAPSGHRAAVPAAAWTGLLTPLVPVGVAALVLA